MSKEEDVKKILDRECINPACKRCLAKKNGACGDCTLWEELSKEICDLFAPKPDDSGLLSDGALIKKIYDILIQPIDRQRKSIQLLDLFKSQRDLTRAECEDKLQHQKLLHEVACEAIRQANQASVERIRKLLSNIIDDWGQDHTLLLQNVLALRDDLKKQEGMS